MEEQDIVIECIFNTTRQEVWRAITQKERMQKWYFDLPEFRPELGFKFTFFGGNPNGTQYKHVCKIIEAIPERKLKYSWEYEGYRGTSFVTFELFDEKEDIRLKLTHSGVGTFPQENDLSFHNFEAGWNYIINTSLKDFLEI